MVDLQQGPIDPKAPEFRTFISDLQGNVLKGHGRDHLAVLVVRFGADYAAVDHLVRSSIGPCLTSFAQQIEQARERRRHLDQGTKHAGALFVGFAVSAQGMRKLNLSFGVGFSSMRDRARQNAWEPAYEPRMDGLLLLAHDDRSALDVAVRDWSETLGLAMEVLVVERGDVIRNQAGWPVEHFGYVDGRSQPVFIESDLQKERASGIERWEPAASLGLALLVDPNGRHGNDSCGSMLVYRKIEQHPARFHEAVERLAARSGVPSRLAGAFAVGRFPDGTPVVEHESPTPSDEPAAIANDFTFSSDPAGSRCPFQSHIRKVNPRGDTVRTGSELAVEKARRITRRGITYGGAANPDATGGVGLLFLAFVASIPEQFEFIERHWVDDRHFLGGLVGRYSPGVGALIGSPRASTAAPAQWPRGWGQATDYLPGLNFTDFTTLRGGEYLFLPAISSLTDPP